MLKPISIFAGVLFISGSLFSQKNIATKEAHKHIGQKVSIHGKVSKAEHRQTGNTQSTVLNIDGGNDLSIIISDDARRNFPYKPEEFYANKYVCVIGVVNAVGGKAEIAINKPADIKVEQPASSGGQIEILPLDIGMTRYFDSNF